MKGKVTNNKSKKVAVVGCGRWGKNLVRNFHELGVLSHVCDSDNEALSVASTCTGALRVTDIQRILDDPDIDGVAVATPSETHYGLAKRVLLSGKDVLVEKPLALTVEEGTELVELAEMEQRVLMVDHLLEYHPAVVKLKEIVDSGELGKIHYLSSTRLDFGYVQQGSDVIWTFAPHDIDTLLFLVEQMPVCVSTMGGDYLSRGSVDVSVNTLDFSTGMKAILFLSWLYPYKERKLVIVGDRGMAMFDDVGENKLTLYPNVVAWAKGKPVTKTADSIVIPVPDDRPLELLCRDFVHCMETRSKPKVSTERVLQVIQLITACQESARNGAPVPLMNRDSRYVHPTATIDTGAVIGKGTKVWHYSHVSRGAVIGERCVLGQNCYIAPNVRVGNGVRIQNNVSVYEGVTLDDNVFCGPSCVFTNDKYPSAVSDNRDNWRRTLVKQRAAIGANATILCGVVIGEGALIGAGAVVTKNVPDGAMVYGNPATIAERKLDES